MKAVLTFHFHLRDTGKMRLWCCCLLLLFSGWLLAQKTGAPVRQSANIVPNPGFEKFANAPVGWSYKGSYFGQVVKYWSSATTASPDIYGPDVHVPQDWAEKGFGAQKPRTGKCLAGLTLFGCTNGKPHCREYIEIQLSEPLVEGQWYYVEFWTTPLEKSLLMNNLGAYFSVSEIKRTTDEVLIREAQVSAPDLIQPAKPGQWVKVSGQFQAKYEAEYLLIGNFQDDERTMTQPRRDDGFNYAYYYIDDVLVKKIPPFLAVPVKPDDLTRQKLEPGARIRLKNIYFEFDKDELMPRSYVELNKLLKIMQDNPGMSIEIVGHTDSYGDDGYNLVLSYRRAEAVAKFLMQQKIAKKRLRYRGEGERDPVATNETDEGRAENRRVEFVVVKK
ncbi:MAG: OmpA family protein [Saprospiraceae bacterium]|nr:OmpA family protein [Saprospiraceae bacterium]